jgi:hypothetical protein
MGNDVKHFAINATDVERAKRFYGRVFGWRFEPWGPPGFFMIATGTKDPCVKGSLQQRRELVPGHPMVGFECTIGVDQDVEKVAAAVRANGGRIVMEKATLAGVGDLIWFEDPEGNVAGAMRYDPKAE